MVEDNTEERHELLEDIPSMISHMEIVDNGRELRPSRELIINLGELPREIDRESLTGTTSNESSTSGTHETRVGWFKDHTAQHAEKYNKGIYSPQKYSWTKHEDGEINVEMLEQEECTEPNIQDNKENLFCENKTQHSRDESLKTLERTQACGNSQFMPLSIGNGRDVEKENRKVLGKSLPILTTNQQNIENTLQSPSEYARLNRTREGKPEKELENINPLEHYILDIIDIEMFKRTETKDVEKIFTKRMMTKIQTESRQRTSEGERLNKITDIKFRSICMEKFKNLYELYKGNPTFFKEIITEFDKGTVKEINRFIKSHGERQEDIILLGVCTNKRFEKNIKNVNCKIYLQNTTTEQKHHIRELTREYSNRLEKDLEQIAEEIYSESRSVFDHLAEVLQDEEEINYDNYRLEGGNLEKMINEDQIDLDGIRVQIQYSSTVRPENFWGDNIHQDKMQILYLKESIMTEDIKYDYVKIQKNKSILDFFQVVQELLNSSDTDQLKEELGILKKALTQMDAELVQIIKGIMDLKIETMKMEMEQQRHELNEKQELDRKKGKIAPPVKQENTNSIESLFADSAATDKAQDNKKKNKKGKNKNKIKDIRSLCFEASRDVGNIDFSRPRMNRGARYDKEEDEEDEEVKNLDLELNYHTFESSKRKKLEDMKSITHTSTPYPNINAIWKHGECTSISKSLHEPEHYDKNTRRMQQKQSDKIDKINLFRNASQRNTNNEISRRRRRTENSEEEEEEESETESSSDSEESDLECNIVQFGGTNDIQKEFNGDNIEELGEFLEFLDNKANLAGLFKKEDNSSKKSKGKYDTQRIALMGVSLKGAAADWLADWKTEENTSRTWEACRKEFLEYFQDDKYKFQLRVETGRNLTMEPKERPTDFAHRVKRKVRIAWDGSSLETILEKQRELFTAGLPPKLSQKCYYSFMDNKKLTYKQITRIADNYYTSMNLVPSKENKSINEINIYDDEEDLEVSMMKYDPNNPKNNQNGTRFCEFCRKMGHTKGFCPVQNYLKEQAREKKIGIAAKDREFYDPKDHKDEYQGYQKGEHFAGGGNISSPHAKTEEQRNMYKNTENYGYHYDKVPDTLIGKQLRFRDRSTNGWSRPREGPFAIPGNNSNRGTWNNNNRSTWNTGRNNFRGNSQGNYRGNYQNRGYGDNIPRGNMFRGTPNRGNNNFRGNNIGNNIQSEYNRNYNNKENYNRNNLETERYGSLNRQQENRNIPTPELGKRERNPVDRLDVGTLRRDEIDMVKAMREVNKKNKQVNVLTEYDSTTSDESSDDEIGINAIEQEPLIGSDDEYMEDTEMESVAEYDQKINPENEITLIKGRKGTRGFIKLTFLSESKLKGIRGDFW